MDSVLPERGASGRRCRRRIQLLTLAILTLSPLAAAAGLVPQDGEQRIELVFWESVRQSNRAEDYDAYLESYPDGRFASLARRRAAYLRQQEEEQAASQGAAARAPAVTGPSPPPAAAERAVGPESEPYQPPRIETHAASLRVLDTANLRQYPSGSAPVTAVLARDSRVEATGRVVNRNWYRVELEDGRSGYLYGELAVPAEGEADDPPATAQSPPPGTRRPPPPMEAVTGAYALIETANLRDYPGASGEVIGVLIKGEPITVTHRVAGRNWYRLALTDGSIGYIYGELIQALGGNSAPETTQ